MISRENKEACHTRKKQWRSNQWGRVEEESQSGKRCQFWMQIKDELSCDLTTSDNVKMQLTIWLDKANNKQSCVKV